MHRLAQQRRMKHRRIPLRPVRRRPTKYPTRKPAKRRRAGSKCVSIRRTKRRRLLRLRPCCRRRPAPPPAAASKSSDSTVNIHYATNRNRLASADREWRVYFMGFFASLPAFVIYGLVILAVLILPWFGKRSWAAWAVLAGSLVLCSMGILEAYVRSQLRDEMSGELYGCRPTDISYGSCEISVPRRRIRRPGDLSRPVSVWIFEAPENPDKHFMLRHVEEHERQGRVLQEPVGAARQVRRSGGDAIHSRLQRLVRGRDLSHGAVDRRSEISRRLDRVLLAVVCRSAEIHLRRAKCRGVDSGTARSAEDLAAAQRSQTRTHHCPQHGQSRASRGAAEPGPEARRPRTEVFRELVLAAPDIDSRVFQSQVLPHIDAQRSTAPCTHRRAIGPC